MSGNRSTPSPGGRRPSTSGTRTGANGGAAGAGKAGAGRGAGKGTGKGPGKGGDDGRPPKRFARTRRVLGWLTIIGLAGILVLLGIFYFAYQATEVPTPKSAFEAQSTYVYYKGAKARIGQFAEQNRESVPLADIAKPMQDAAIAAEDRTFYTNKGIDPKGIIRAAFSNAKGNSTQGASTITQQYVKILYLDPERTFKRKAKEALISLKLQQEQSKDEILEGYLNTIYFGRGAYGVQAAAKAYFDTTAKKLTVPQAATLAAVLNSPTYLSSREGRDALTSRYDYVLRGMASMGSLDSTEADRYKGRLPRFTQAKASSDNYGDQRGFMLTMVRAELHKHGFTDAEIDSGGLRIETTFTRKAMRAVEQGVLQERPEGLRKLHVAAASVDVKTGALLGFYGGQDYLKSQLNWARLGGSPGSAFKPFALAAGLKAGFALKDTFDGNSPYEFENGDKVVNEGEGEGIDYGSRISLLKATEESVNTAYSDLTEAIPDGPKKILDMAVAMGVPRDSPGLNPNNAIALGSATVSPITMANAYATIANEGVHHDWFTVRRVTSAKDGKVLYRARPQSNRVLPEDIDRDVSYALQQVVKSGTGQNAQALGRPAAGKTGTATNGDGDVSSSWFVGYTPQVATAVMYVRGKGNEALNGYLSSYFGANFPTYTWRAIMEGVLDGLPPEDFPPAANVDGDAPDDNHAPYTPPPPPTKKPKPSRAPASSSAPTVTQAPPTKQPSPPPPPPTPTPSQGPPSQTCDPTDPTCTP